MDLRHGFCGSWRRSSPAPPSVRTCTPASAVFRVQRRLSPRRRRAAKQCLSASCVVAIESAYEPTTAAPAEPALFEVHEGQGFCSPDAAACAAVLQTRLSKAHSSAASAALVVQDTLEEKLVATASLDKGMAIWRFYSPQGECESMDGPCDESIEVTRLKVPGAPVFSLAKIPEVLPDGTIVRKRPKPPGIYLGTASKEVLTWMLGSKDVTDKVVLDGHTGWVRSLALTGKWLFSCGCNYLRLWDTTFRTPKECDSARLFTGDILAIAASDGRVFTAGADGSLRSWTISRAGDLQEGPARDKAHDGRVSACAISGERVFTVSYDGSVKAWDADTLELIAEVRGAHNGDKIFCTAVGANGVIFTGGDDKLVRAWDQDLNPIGAPLEGHGASVRVLSAGRRALLVSGDADGDVCIWETYPVDLLPARAAGGAAAALTVGVPVEPSATAVEVAMDEAAKQQLETMFAAAPPPGEKAAAAAAAYDPVATPVAAPAEVECIAVVDPGVVDQQPDAAYTHEQAQAGAEAEATASAAVQAKQHQQQLQQEAAVYYPPVPEEQAPLAGGEELPTAQEQVFVQHHEHCPAGATVEWQQEQVDGYAAAPDATAAGMEVCAAEPAAVGPSVELFVDGLVDPHGHAEAGGHHAAAAVAAAGGVGGAEGAPAVNANGSGGFAVMAATVSENAQHQCSSHAAAAGTEDDEEEEDSQFCQIEVESVASAVAASCLLKDVDCRTSVAASGRTL